MTTIVTRRLQLKESIAGSSAIKTMITWLNDPENVTYSEQRHIDHTQYSQYNYINSFKPPNQFREIHYGTDLVGTITAYVDPYNDIADMGILIGRKYWGDGIGREAWQGLADVLLATGVRKLEAACMSLNRGMIKIFEKSGMHEEGRKEAHFLLDKEITADMVLWAKFSG